jgi:hypothetical protein
MPYSTTSRKTAQHQDELASKWAAAEATLADLLHHESTLEASQAMVRERMKWQLPAFARAYQNMAAATAL